MKHVNAVIMAGGGGTRLWPVSRRKHPKHILPLISEETLFQSTLSRLEGFIPPENILVVTTAGQASLLMSQAPGIPAANFLLEPQPCGTASVVGLAAAVLLRRDPQAIMLVLPSDHYIRNLEEFHHVMRVAIGVAKKGFLVTIGIQPTFPATGYGYIQQGQPLKGRFDYPVYHVVRFTEKPDESTASRMLSGGDHSWNSGMFIWRADRILEEIRHFLPGLSSTLEKISAAWGTPHQEAVLASEWPALKTVTIDYGIMEHAREVAVLPASNLEWNDVGSWDSLFDVLQPDSAGNVVINCDHLPLETHHTLTFASGNKLILTIGVDDLIIVDTADALLVCRRDKAQQVRKAIEELKKSQRDQYL